jgi:2-amino-4-hydroxy-6-hydroxymethyldihydropteridine diphosphokinase
MNETVYLSLGANLGDRLANLNNAVAALSPAVEVQKVSSIYETEPWGFLDQPRFLNLALFGQTSLEPELLLKNLKTIEATLGRTASFHYGPRLIDLDILFYGNLIVNTPILTIPHMHIAQRAFVLVPLAEIAPDFVHPQSGVSVARLLEGIDHSGVHVFSERDES